jgi:predicted  nucleic acid-binding Zn-ribbon protein
MVSDARKDSRVAVPHVMVKISTRERMKSSYVKDLSEGGLFVKADKTVPVGRDLVIDLLPPGWAAPLRLHGIVARVQGEPTSGMGVRFEGNSDEVISQLKALVDEYKASVTPPAEEARDAERQLQQLLGSYADLQNAMQELTVELEAERARRTESQRLVIELSAELEATNHSSPTIDASELIRAELQLSQNEVSELRTALSERQGELEAYKKELSQLEADESTSRRLATQVAREKSEIQTELARYKGLLAQLESQNKQSASEGQLLKAEAKSLQMQCEAANKDLARAQQAFAEKDAQVNALMQRIETAEKRATEFQTRLTAAESQHTLLKGEVVALQRKNTQLESSLKDSQDRQAQLRNKERELRELLSMVSSQQAVAPEPAPPEEPAPPALEHTARLPIRVKDDDEILVEEPAIHSSGSGAVWSEAPVEIDVGASGFATESKSSDSIAIYVDTDDAFPNVGFEGMPSLDTGWLPEQGTAQGDARERLEAKLRTNASLAKTDNFDDITPPDGTVRSVKGLMEAGGRLSELMVLGRGLVSPNELVDGLIFLLSEGALCFEDEKRAP